jgi:hypothetical protein
MAQRHISLSIETSVNCYSGRDTSTCLVAPLIVVMLQSD